MFPYSVWLCKSGFTPVLNLVQYVMTILACHFRELREYTPKCFLIFRGTPTRVSMVKLRIGELCLLTLKDQKLELNSP